jgi:hypothetical protein
MPSGPQDRRRTIREPVQLEAVLRGRDAGGRAFFDRGEVVSVDRFGARVRTRFRLELGGQIELEIPTEPNPRAMRVVWRGDGGSFYDGMVGLEFADPEESWSETTLKVR